MKYYHAGVAVRKTWIFMLNSVRKWCPGECNFSFNSHFKKCSVTATTQKWMTSKLANLVSAGSLIEVNDISVWRCGCDVMTMAWGVDAMWMDICVWHSTDCDVADVECVFYLPYFQVFFTVYTFITNISLNHSRVGTK